LCLGFLFLLRFATRNGFALLACLSTRATGSSFGCSLGFSGRFCFGSLSFSSGGGSGSSIRLGRSSSGSSFFLSSSTRALSFFGFFSTTRCCSFLFRCSCKSSLFGCLCSRLRLSCCGRGGCCACISFFLLLPLLCFDCGSRGSLNACGSRSICCKVQ
jgi:hypothetical protein